MVWKGHLRSVSPESQRLELDRAINNAGFVFLSAATSPGSTLSPSCCSCAKHFGVSPTKLHLEPGLQEERFVGVRQVQLLPSGRGQRDDAVALGPQLPKRTRPSGQRR